VFPLCGWGPGDDPFIISGVGRDVYTGEETRMAEVRARRVRRTGGAAAFLVGLAVALTLPGGVASAEVRVGTDGAETLVGTNAPDRLTGGGGNDALKGKAAGDTYHFANHFGEDTLTETATVGKKRLPGGSDTLSFADFGTDPLWVGLVPAWAAQGYNKVVAGPDDGVALGASPVENVTGGTSDDTLIGGAAKNSYSGGRGGDDTIVDYGGWDGNGARVAPAAREDAYKGFASGTGIAFVTDYGGTADSLDLRPLRSTQVSLARFGSDASTANGDESLVVTLNDTTQVYVFGYFAPLEGASQESFGQENRRMEKIVFSDRVVTGAGVQSLVR